MNEGAMISGLILGLLYIVLVTLIYYWPDVMGAVERFRRAYHRWRIRRAHRKMIRSIHVMISATNEMSKQLLEAGKSAEEIGKAYREAMEVT